MYAYFYIKGLISAVHAKHGNFDDGNRIEATTVFMQIYKSAEIVDNFSTFFGNEFVTLITTFSRVVTRHFLAFRTRHYVRDSPNETNFSRKYTRNFQGSRFIFVNVELLTHLVVFNLVVNVRFSVTCSKGNK